jgi:hypothetical protein
VSGWAERKWCPLRKINNFTAKDPDTCAKCGKAIVPGQEIGWLRDANRMGHFHVDCTSRPTLEALTVVRVQDTSTREGLPVRLGQGSQGSGSPARTPCSGKAWRHGERRREIHHRGTAVRADRRSCAEGRAVDHRDGSGAGREQGARSNRAAIA